MKEYEEKFDYVNDGAENEDSISVEVKESFSDYEYLGILDCGVKIGYAIEQIKSAFTADKFLPKDAVRGKLLGEDLENVVDEMLKYAVESGLLLSDGSYYMLND